MGPGLIRAFENNSWIIVDGAWRILNGQRPHLDFYSNIGFLCYLPTALALGFSHGLAAVSWGQSISGTVIALLSVPVVTARLRAPYSTLYCLALTLLAIAPFSMGDFFTMGSQAVMYNRTCYALIGILLVECACPVRYGDRTFGTTGGVIAGLIVALTFFIKFTFAGTAVIMILGVIPVRTYSRGRWLGLVSTALIAGIAGLAFLRFDVAAMLHDIHIVAAARRIGILYTFGKPLQNLSRLTSICAWLAAATLALRQYGAPGSVRRWIWVLSVTLTIDVLTLATNTSFQATDFPFSALAILLMVGDVADALPGAEAFRVARFAMVAWGLSIGLINPLLDAAGIVNLAWGSVMPPTRFATARLESPVGSFLVRTGIADPVAGTKSDVDEINDGLRLLREHSPSAEKIGALWFSNPFPYLLQRQSMKGGSVCYDYGGNFNETSGPAPEEAFGGADVVVVPRMDEQDYRNKVNLQPLPRIYGPYLEANFTRVAESRYWWLYRKRRS